MARYWSNLAWAVLFMAGAYCFWRWCISYILPFAIGALMAFLLRPIARWFERHGLSPAVAAFWSLVVGGGSVALTLAAVMTLLVSELVQLMQRLPRYVKLWRTILAYHRALGARVMADLHLTPGVLNSSMGGLYHVAETLLRHILLFLLHVPDAGLVVVIAVLAAYFFLRDHHWASQLVLLGLPPSLRPQYQKVKYDIVNGTLGFFKAELVLVSVTAAITTAGLLLIGARYAVLVGMSAGLMDLVPYLGPTVILGPWALVLLMTGQYFGAAKLGLVLFAVAIARQILEPRLVGANMGLHPLVAIVALYLGFRTFGASGVLIGPLTALALRVLYQSRTTVKATF